MRKCNECNYQNPDYINICLNCGNELDEFVNRDKIDEDDIIEEKSLSETCECNVPSSENVTSYNKYDDNYYVDNSYEIESVPMDYNGKKSYYEYLQSMKDDVKPVKGRFNLNKNKFIAIAAVCLIFILVLTPGIVSSYQENTERSLFNTYAASSIDLEVTANDFLVQVLYSNASTDEKLSSIKNMSNGVNTSINTLKRFSNASTNETYREFINLEVECLEADKEALDSYQEMMDITNKYEKGEYSDSQAYDAIQKVSYNQNNTDMILENHKRMNEIIEKNPMIKSDFNNLRITPIYQTLAKSGNATSNQTLSNQTLNNTTSTVTS